VYADARVSHVSGTTVEDLTARYQQADATAAAGLVDQLSPRLYRFFASQFGNRTDAADMLQETWLRLHRVRHTYRPGVPLLPWVYAIAHRVRVHSYRKRRRTSREVGVNVLPEPPHRDGRLVNERSAFAELLASLRSRKVQAATV
jgi:RNA polymerase sigma-70 factor (ECF subfamily)